MSNFELMEPSRHSVRQAHFGCPSGKIDREPEMRERSQNGAPVGPDSSNVLVRETLYAEFAPLVRRLIRQYGQDAEIRQDLAGEIYCRFCTLLDVYDPTRGVPLRPYLVRQLSAAIYTYARQQWRIQRRETAWETEPGKPEPVPTLDPTPNWVSALSQQQVLAALPEAMMKLPLRQRKVVIWRYYEERSFEEIAQLLGIQTATARSLLRHGLNNLRKQMRPTYCEAI